MKTFTQKVENILTKILTPSTEGDDAYIEEIIEKQDRAKIAEYMSISPEHHRKLYEKYDDYKAYGRNWDRVRAKKAELQASLESLTGYSGDTEVGEKRTVRYEPPKNLSRFDTKDKINELIKKAETYSSKWTWKDFVKRKTDKAYWKLLYGVYDLQFLDFVEQQAEVSRLAQKLNKKGIM